MTSMVLLCHFQVNHFHELPANDQYPLDAFESWYRLYVITEMIQSVYVLCTHIVHVVDGAGPLVVLVHGWEAGPASTVQLVDLDHCRRRKDLLLVKLTKLFLCLVTKHHIAVGPQQYLLVLSHGPDVHGTQVFPGSKERLRAGRNTQEDNSKVTKQLW